MWESVESHTGSTHLAWVQKVGVAQGQRVKQSFLQIGWTYLQPSLSPQYSLLLQKHVKFTLCLFFIFQSWMKGRISADLKSSPAMFRITRTTRLELDQKGHKYWVSNWRPPTSTYMLECFKKSLTISSHLEIIPWFSLPRNLLVNCCLQFYFSASSEGIFQVHDLRKNNYSWEHQLGTYNEIWKYQRWLIPALPHQAQEGHLSPLQAGPHFMSQIWEFQLKH